MNATGPTSWHETNPAESGHPSASAQALRHVIWDWNGTLMDDTWLCIATLNLLLEARGLPSVAYEDYRQHFAFPVKEYYRKLGFDFEAQSFEDLSVEFIAAYEERRLECALHNGVQETLQKIRDAGLTQSILSAYMQKMLDEIIPHYGLQDYFVRLVGARDIYAHSKVARAREWLAELDYAPSEILLVGDTIHDAEVAAELGVRCVLCAHGHYTPERLAHPEFPVCHSLEEVLEHAIGAPRSSCLES